ncbi:DEAD/DEAH box helicase [Gordonibacter massiliensis (ex Traore et al. 2017)]|uniref:DEAD/DEAH box helicase n=1 Tax=Gordonibacter massiliensis (ex Traore et al. 2017) TaxID=1841863 RepID=UPI0034A03FD5
MAAPMISEDAIAEHCYPRTLQRAQAIATSDRNILTKQVRYDGDETVLSAFVASSNGWNDRYRTSASFDEEADVVTDYACTCPAYREYDGMCKHSAALLLAYGRAPEKFLGYREVRTASTSPSIAAFMERARQADAEEPGTVDVEATVAYGYRTWSAHFRVAGPNGSYVLRSISDFVRRMRTGERFAYGKKLAFAHVPSAFTDRGRALVGFLDKAVSLREQANGPLYGRYRSREEVERSLDLSDWELIELLDVLDGTSFTVEGTDYGTRSVTQARIVHEDPFIDVRLNRTDKGGFAIARGDDIPFAAQGERMYVWQDDLFYRCSPGFARTADFLRNVYGSDDDRLFVSETDMPLFCAAVLPAIEEHLHVIAPAEVNAYRPVPCQLEFYFDRDKRGVTCDAQAVYGERRHPLFEALGSGAAGGRPSRGEGPDAPPGPLRDERLEGKARDLVERYFDLPDPFIEIGDDEAIATLVFGGLARFQELGEVFTTPAFDRLLRDKQPRIATGLSLAGDLVNLTVSSDDLPASELAALLSSYRKRKRYHRLRNGAFMSLEGYDLAELDRLVEDFGITAKELASGTVQLPAFRALYLDEALADAERDESFTRYVENFRQVDERAYRAPASLAGTLRPYQEAGFRWMSALADAGFGGILADEMGLGKSVQLIAFLLARREEAREAGPSLIVCPASLVYNWKAEFERFAPELDVRAVAGTKRERTLARDEACGDAAHGRGTTGGKPCDVLVTSYDLLRIDADDYARRSFFCCVLDEAQYVKNHATKTARGVKRVRARHRFALTGTPVENRPSELWSVFDFLMPGLLGSYMRFRERFELPLLGGDDEAARRLQALVGPFMLRRQKADVLRDLPDKLESVVRVSLEGEQRRLYAASEQQLREALTAQHRERKSRERDRTKVEVLAELTRLRQLCCDPGLLYENYDGPAAKLDAVVELVESALDAGEKTLVFSQFTSFLARISERLARAGVPHYTITGATPKKKRLELVDAFNADDTPAFLVSLKAGGTGLNLTGASVVVHADPWWNAAAQNQATDRAHRIGQTKVVSVHQVIAEGTIEERILRLQDTKSELADRLVAGGGVSLASLSKEELADLLQG